MTPHFKDIRFYFIYIKNSDAIISHIFADVSRNIYFFLRIYADCKKLDDNDIMNFFIIKYNLLP